MSRYQRVWVDEARMRELFEEAGCLEPEEHGYTVIPEPGGEPGPNAPEDAVISRMVLYFDRFGKPIAAAHEYLREDRSIAASGKRDPKRITIGNKQYVLMKS
ncbi:MAG: hypothetical protein ACR2FZ_01860 [Thermoleophilaceae bacterium]